MVSCNGQSSITGVAGGGSSVIAVVRQQTSGMGDDVVVPGDTGFCAAEGVKKSCWKLY